MENEQFEKCSVCGCFDCGVYTLFKVELAKYEQVIVEDNGLDFNLERLSQKELDQIIEVLGNEPNWEEVKICRECGCEMD